MDVDQEQSGEIKIGGLNHLSLLIVVEMELKMPVVDPSTVV